MNNDLPLAELRLCARINSRQLAAETFGVTPETFARWERNDSAPIAVRIALHLMAGHLPQLDWAGWTFNARDGLLWSPEGQAFHPGDLRSIHYLRAALRDLMAEKAQKRVDAETDNPYLDNVIPFRQRTAP